ncbi:hypothetical protein [Rhodanobacter sp. DHG33]|uniref:hypothetical protein n=1 Tax=Rhodanobacter sp. DHG33 TaxID=2775921 RepID=UPI00177D8328|nr:hypothetical protein [Rhodanobacter sp. DHG33]MBD8900442.1 hypothetical protein [Rhodanobacter sp. DHG33]
MITEEMLGIYSKFDGDIDGFTRAGSAYDRSIISAAQWLEIVRLVQELHTVKASLVSDHYSAQVEQSLSAVAATTGAKYRLWLLA